MEKIGGSRFLYILWLVFVAHMCTAEPVRIQIKDTSGNQVDAVGVGQLFDVHVIIEDAALKDTPPRITTPPEIPLRWAGKRMELVASSQMAVQYIYRGHANTAGTYQIGPATLVHQGTTIRSNTVSLSVTDQPLKKVSQSSAAYDHMKVEASARSGFVGESIPISVTFYYTDNSTRIVNPLFHTSQDIIIRGYDDFQEGTQQIDGVKYYTVRWNLYLIAQKAGRISVPPFSIEYQLERRPFGRFGPLMYESKRVYSDYVVLTIDELPAHQGPLLGIGTFDTVQLSVDPDNAQEGDAMTLVLEVAGITDWESVHAPSLQKIPQGLRYYESKEQLMANQATGTYKKRFEYVLQGLQFGTWTIPAQSFTVFDTTVKKYKTVRSNSVTVTISKSEEQPDALSHDTSLENKEQKSEMLQPTDTAFNFSLQEQGPWSSYPARAPFSWWFFVLLLLIPLVCLFGFVFFTQIVQFFTRYKMNTHQHTAFTRAKISLHKAREGGKAEQIYYSIIQLFVDKYQVSAQQVSISFIDEKLMQAGCSAHIIAEWNKFFVLISSQVFGTPYHHNSSHVFTQALYWIDLLEKYL